MGITERINNNLQALYNTDDPIYKSLICDKLGFIPYAGMTWELQTSSFSTTTINKITYGDGLFVAVGNSGKIAISYDGKSWSQKTVAGGFVGIFYDVCFGRNIYVIVGAAGQLQTSLNGITWTSRTSGFGASNIYNIAYGNSKFVIVGESGKIATSTDGITWALQTSAGGYTGSFQSITFGNDIFVAVGNNGEIQTSVDGNTWESKTSSFGSTNILGVTFGNNYFIAVGDSGKIAISTDADVWTQKSNTFGGTQIVDVVCGIDTFVAVGILGKIATSIDNGENWTSRTSQFGTTNILGVTYGQDQFISVGASGKMSLSDFTISAPTDLDIGAIASQIEYLRLLGVDLLKQMYIDQADNVFLKYQLENFFSSLKLENETNYDWIQRTIASIFQQKLSRASIIYALRPYSSQEPEIYNVIEESGFCDFSYCDIYIKDEAQYVLPAIAESYDSSYYTIRIILYDTPSEDIYSVTGLLEKIICAGISYILQINYT